MTLLVTWLWQGLAIACATAALLGCARRLNAATRHAIWWLACVAVLTLPATYAAATGPSADSATSPAAIPIAGAALPLPAAPDWLLASVVAVWLVVAAFGCARILRGVRTVVRLKRFSRPLPSARASRLPMWSSARSTGRRPRLHVSDHIRGACAVGLGPPVILVSRSLVNALDDGQLDDIVMHERAHLERHDDWTRLIQAIVAAVAGLHPAWWLIGRRIDLEREAACDDHVVRRCGAARDYARSLVQAATIASTPGVGFNPRSFPGALTFSSALGSRVRRLLDPARDRGRLTIRATIVTIAILATAVGVSARLPAMVVFVETTVDLPRLAARSPIAVPALGRTAFPGFDSPAPAGSAVAPAREAEGQRAEAMLAGSLAHEAGSRAHQPEAKAPLVAMPGAAAVPAEVLDRPLAIDAPRSSEESPSGNSTSPAPRAADIPADVIDRPLAIDAPRSSEDNTSGDSMSLAPWTAVARSATSAGQGVARAGTTAGTRARDAGVSVSRFFGRASKAIAGRF